MTTSPLNENAYVTLDGSGNGTLKMTPWGGGVTWQPSSVSVKCSSATNEAVCKIYVGPSATDPYFVHGTFSGSTGDSSDRVGSYQIDTHGNNLWAVWSGGDAGATATMSVSGVYQQP